MPDTGSVSIVVAFADKYGAVSVSETVTLVHSPTKSDPKCAQKTCTGDSGAASLKTAPPFCVSIILVSVAAWMAGRNIL